VAVSFPRRWGVGALAIVAAGAAVFFILSQLTQPGPLPPLLQGVQAGSGTFGDCPHSAEQAGGSVELNRRLVAQFPSGTNQARLETALTSQGFEMLGACKSDPDVRIAVFRQQSGGGFTFDMTAIVFWQADPSGAIQWARGDVIFTGV
jgi:hypothetical protein